MQFYTGVYSQGQLTPILLVNEYLKHKQIDQVLYHQIFVRYPTKVW